MREKANQIRHEEEQYRFVKPDDSSTLKKRLDLNDLLKRAKDQEKNDKKFNILIYSCATFVVAVLLLIVSV